MAPSCSLLNFRSQTQHAAADRDAHIAAAEKALTTVVDPARLRRAELKGREERVQEIWDGVNEVRGTNDRCASNIPSAFVRVLTSSSTRTGADLEEHTRHSKTNSCYRNIHLCTSPCVDSFHFRFPTLRTHYRIAAGRAGHSIWPPHLLHILALTHPITLERALRLATHRILPAREHRVLQLDIPPSCPLALLPRFYPAPELCPPICASRRTRSRGVKPDSGERPVRNAATYTRDRPARAADR